MLASRLGPRTISQTLATWLDKISRRLAGGIAPAHQCHFLPGAQPSLERRCPIVDAGALEGCEIFEIETAIPCAAGDDDGAGANALLVREWEQKASSIRSGLALQARHLGRGGPVDAEF